jgi:DNA-directed RNA polymerase subunit RPC12/RpoP
MNKMQMIKSKIDSLPKGSVSVSNHYWCVTCKKFFVLDKPECPYMSGMCVNTPIAVENLAPESTEALEKFGLFYPKIPQRILSTIINADYPETGRQLAEIYLNFLKEWKFEISRQQPLQTVKSFIILLTGCETAQRINEKSITFVLMDAGKIWDKEKIKDILTGSLAYLKTVLNIEHALGIDFIDILGEREVGKYYCAKCGMLFEFGMRRDTVTCPLMSQKCMFDPQHIEKTNYTSDKLIKQLAITPDIYKRFIHSIDKRSMPSGKMNELLQEWKITERQDEIMDKLF